MKCGLMSKLPKLMTPHCLHALALLPQSALAQINVALTTNGNTDTLLSQLVTPQKWQNYSFNLPAGIHTLLITLESMDQELDIIYLNISSIIIANGICNASKQYEIYSNN